MAEEKYHLLNMSDLDIHRMTSFLDMCDTYMFFQLNKALWTRQHIFKQCMQAYPLHRPIDICFKLLDKVEPQEDWGHTSYRDATMLGFLENNLEMANFMNMIFFIAHMEPYSKKVVSWMMRHGLTINKRISQHEMKLHELQKSIILSKKKHSPPLLTSMLPPPPPPPPQAGPIIEEMDGDDPFEVNPNFQIGNPHIQIGNPHIQIGNPHIQIGFLPQPQPPQNVITFNAGRANTAIGFKALMNTTRGSYNTAIGANALKNNRYGRDNTGIGMNTEVLTDPDGCLLLGKGATAIYDGELAIGSVKHPVATVKKDDTEYIRVRVNGRLALLPLIFLE